MPEYLVIMTPVEKNRDSTLFFCALRAVVTRETIYCNMLHYEILCSIK